MGAEVEVVVFVVDEFEGEHGRRKRSIDLGIEEKRKNLTQSSPFADALRASRGPRRTLRRGERRVCGVRS